MFNFLITLSLMFSSLAFSQVAPNQVLSADKFNESTSHIGEIKHSLLTESEFQSLYGSCWVKMTGQSISGSDLDSHTSGRLASLPNSAGRFLRDTGGDAPALGSLQSDAIRNISGTFRDKTTFTNDWSVSGAFTKSTGSNFDYTGHSEIRRQNGVINFNASDSVPTANENRPKNMGVNLFVKINHNCN